MVISCTCFAVSRNNKVPSQCDGSGYLSRRHDMTRKPSLHLTGHWLEAAGFGTDTPVIVTVERGKLVIETELRF
ncbi:SymE family type I addiction module toxin [Pectobacterium carotovorum]|uniref:SymE family type I addiction module toxin n=1 Tax=Pectobacterium carotovorum TaxID=554 RepID=UPI0030166006